MSGKEWGALSAYLTEGLWELVSLPPFPLQQAVKPPLRLQRHPPVAATKQATTNDQKARRKAVNDLLRPAYTHIFASC